MSAPAVYEGGDPATLKDELRHIIEHSITRHPRSLQRAIGPSELGTPCTRKLAYKLATTARQSERSPGRSWLPTIGTAVHSWLHDAMAAFNTLAGQERFILEQQVCVGTVGGEPVFGSADVFDIVTGTVVDWKIVGATTLRSARSKGMSETYHRQVQLYGRGFVAAGHRVEHVAVCYLPRNGDLSDTVWCCEPYSPESADGVLLRAEGVHAAVRIMGLDAVLSTFAPVDDYCTGCPFFRPAWRGPLVDGCPGSVRSDIDGLVIPS